MLCWERVRQQVHPSFRQHWSGQADEMGFERRFLQGRRPLFLGLLIVTFFVLYTLFPSSSFASWKPSLDITGSRARSGCTPQEWSSGKWVPKTLPTNKTSLTKSEDALDFLGFESCASSREFFWHLAADEQPKWDRYPGVASWQWQPPETCDVRAFDSKALVKDMVEQGGWLLIGGTSLFLLRSLVSLAHKMQILLPNSSFSQSLAFCTLTFGPLLTTLRIPTSIVLGPRISTSPPTHL